MVLKLVSKTYFLKKWKRDSVVPLFHHQGSPSRHPQTVTHLCAQLPPGGSYRSTRDATSAHFLSVVHGQTSPTRGLSAFLVGVQQTEQRRPRPNTQKPDPAASPAPLTGVEMLHLKFSLGW